MRETLLDILAEPRPSDILQATVADIVPEIRDCIGFDGGIHHGETVFEHLLLACDLVSPKFPLVRLAALFHDIGKPQSFKDGMFRNHETASAETAGSFLVGNGFREDEIRFVTSLVRNHMMDIRRMRPGHLAHRLSGLASDGVAWQDFVRLRVADKRANMRHAWKPWEVLPETRRLAMRMRGALAWRPPVPPPKTAVTGDEVMEILGLVPGPEVGRMLREVEGLDREQALAMLQSMEEGMRP